MSPSHACRSSGRSHSFPPFCLSNSQARRIGRATPSCGVTRSMDAQGYAVNTSPFHSSIRNLPDEAEVGPASILDCGVGTSVREWPTYFNLSYYDRTGDHTVYCTMFSLQICFLLCEKSMRQKPPPRVPITFRGSRSPCTIPIR